MVKERSSFFVRIGLSKYLEYFLFGIVDDLLQKDHLRVQGSEFEFRFGFVGMLVDSTSTPICIV